MESFGPGDKPQGRDSSRSAGQGNKTMMDLTQIKDSGLQFTLARGLAILEYVIESKGFVRLRDVAKTFSINRSTALRILQTLESLGYLRKYEELKVYMPGPKTCFNFNQPATDEELISAAKPHLLELASKTNNCAHLAILKDSRAILIDVEHSPGKITVKQAVDDSEPLYCSAVGKAIYAFLPESRRSDLAGRMLFKQLTPHTLKNVEELETESKAIRSQFVAFDKREISSDVYCIACPILDQFQAPIASIGISIIAATIEGQITEQDALISSVKETAAVILQNQIVNQDKYSADDSLNNRLRRI